MVYMETNFDRNVCSTWLKVAPYPFLTSYSLNSELNTRLELVLVGLLEIYFLRKTWRVQSHLVYDIDFVNHETAAKTIALDLHSSLNKTREYG